MLRAFRAAAAVADAAPRADASTAAAAAAAAPLADSGVAAKDALKSAAAANAAVVYTAEEEKESEQVRLCRYSNPARYACTPSVALRSLHARFQEKRDGKKPPAEKKEYESGTHAW